MAGDQKDHKRYHQKSTTFCIGGEAGREERHHSSHSVPRYQIAPDKEDPEAMVIYGYDGKKN